MTQAASKNPFLSPSNTGTSQTPTLVPQHTSSSYGSRNPFIDPLASFAPASPIQSSSYTSSSANPYDGLSPSEIREFEQAKEDEEAAKAGKTPPHRYQPTVQQAPPVEPSTRPTITSSSQNGSSTGLTGNGIYIDDDAAMEAAIAASLGTSPARTSSVAQANIQPPALPSRPQSFASPSGPPPITQPHSPPPASDPPPAYSPSNTNERILDSGPRLPSFVERPTIQTSVSSVYPQSTGIQPQSTGWSDGGVGNPGGYLSPGEPGWRPLGQPLSPSDGTYHHGQPPSLPPSSASYSGPSSRPSPHLVTSGPPKDLTPSRTPIIGRPYMLDGRVLIYPLNHRCWKCNNTGFKNDDPTHPCRTSCWKKYARPYSSALQHSWANPGPNYQQPLGFNRTSWSPYNTSTSNQQYYPQMNFGAGAWRPVTNVPPSGAVIYQPGDPRIGGRLCSRCVGRGLTMNFLLIDETCGACGGVGRLF
ncbi:hypothetical protein [Phaffia rhodozyma]|uniref:Uncharacterized protein n=1 Tax=Phaffia rhodozyma TaxID=264483 RepID=A0A0F7SK05_PHARH|nr:hypothetical protein [Phaffia rhodozyma]